MSDIETHTTPANAGVTELQAAKAAFVEAGGVLQHKAVQTALADAASRAAQEHQTATAPRNARVATFVNDALGWLGMTFVVVVLVGGVLAALLALPAAEYAAIYKGLNVVTQDQTIVTLTTVSLLLAVVVLPFLKHAYADALPDGKKPKPTPLARRAVAMLEYLGIVKPRSTPAPSSTLLEANYLAVVSALGLTKWTVVFASALGRLGELMKKYGQQPLGTAWESVQQSITAQEILGLVASLGTLITIIAVLDVLTLLVFISFKNTAGRLNLGKEEASAAALSFEALRDAAQASLLNDLTLQLRMKTKRSQTPPAPSPTSPDSSNEA